MVRLSNSERDQSLRDCFRRPDAVFLDPRDRPEGDGAPRGATFQLTPFGAALLGAGVPASQRSIVGLVASGPYLPGTAETFLIQEAFASLHPFLVQPSKAALRSEGGR